MSLGLLSFKVATLSQQLIQNLLHAEGQCGKLIEMEHLIPTIGMTDFSERLSILKGLLQIL